MNPLYFLVWITSRMIFSLFYDIKISGVENLPDSGCILASNHASFFDPPAIGSSLPNPIYYLARKSLWNNPIIKWGFDRLNCIPVDQEKPDMTGLKRMIQVVRDGNAVIMFPEGTRTHDGQLRPAQPGIGMVVAKTGAPVVPIRIYGTFEAFPRTGKLRLFVPMRLMIGKPLTFPPVKSSRENYQMISEKIMEAITALKPES